MVDLDLPALPLKISTRFWGGWVLYGLMIIQVILGGRVGTIISKSFSDFLACETVPTCNIHVVDIFDCQTRIRAQDFR